ncbi:AI-2E family transporter [Alteraurantiacibacter buctensis]|uniref:AI-2E family transporter n=1 Tax=Alteraurantiacibacter buctensis TaxID=1503981 RepID=A0A844Z0K4_9SPHN|nr:AI-2E family transporter [Alteraurantiacibacter buctensis]MXO73339.1 AI-2E family transporter [Alteraurantiacibacter buctensis]
MASQADQQPDPAASPAPSPRRRTMGFAAQELRLISALVVILAIGLFLALPFVLSIGAVVFLPLVSAMVLTILLSPLADKLAGWGLPNTLASLLSMVVMVLVILLALTAVLSPAIALYDELPQMIATVGERFSELRGNLSWLARINDQIAGITGGTSAREVVLASPSLLEKVAVATPTVVLELLLTIMMTFFMVESRVRLRRRLVLQRQQLDASLKAARVMRAVQDRVAAYILTVGVINLGVGVIVTLGAWAMGVTAPLMWGGLAALLNFIPYIGPMAMVALLALFGLGTAESPLVGLIPAAAYLGLHTIESNVVTPAVLGARFTMNPVMILLALSYFSWIWGVAGALLSVPLLLALTALVDHLGKPNLIGFLFGEPLFANNLLELAEGD